MAKNSHLRSVPGGKRSRSKQPELAAGALYGGYIELQSGERLSIRLLTGDVVSATAAPGVTCDLLADAQSRRSLVLVTQVGEDLLVMGALQTQRAASVDAEGNFEVRARSVKLTATEDVRLASAQASLELSDEGRTELVTDRLNIRARARMRVLSALVELP